MTCLLTLLKRSLLAYRTAQFRHTTTDYLSRGLSQRQPQGEALPPPQVGPLAQPKQDATRAARER